MKPDVSQHLQSMAKALNEIVLPELQDKPFALEQANLIVASLNLLAEVQEHQFAYVRQEFDDTRCLLAVWRQAHPEGADPAMQQIVTAPHGDADTRNLGELAETVTGDKARLRTLMAKAPLPPGSPVEPLLHSYIERQLARETAWLRLTGFIQDASAIPAIANVLDSQKNTPLHTTNHSTYPPHQ